MGYQRPDATASQVSGVALAILLSACAPRSEPTPTERLAEARSLVFTNGDFETGAANAPPPGWTVTPYQNPGVTIQSPQTRAGLNLLGGGNPLTFTLDAPGGPGSQPDPSLGVGASMRWPRYGNKVAIVNQLGAAHNVNSMLQTMTVAAADVDGSDGLVHVRFVVAPVLENPNHTPDQQPYYFVQLDNLTRNLTLYKDYNASAQPGVPWKISNGFYYTDWQLVDIAPGSASLAVGDQVALEILGAGCSLGGHFGQVYVDGVGSTLPGPFVTATGPAAANAGSSITYALTYKNGGAAAAGGTTVELNIPPNTTFQSASAPGLTCTLPPVGMGGLVSCVVGALPAGGSGGFTVTVQIDPAATGTITAGNYDVYATGVAPLLGPKVNTTVTSGVTYADLGVTIDNGVSNLVWGQAVTYTLVASNAGPNAVVGATVSDPVPTNLTAVTWTCAGAGGGACPASGSGAINTLVSLPVGATVTYTVTGTVASGSNAGSLADIVTITPPALAVDSFPTNNSAGDIDPIRSPNGVGCVLSSDCVSGVCDPADHLCGWAVDHGPCGAANAATVCRSGACSVDGACEPAGGCNVDADCAGGAWCDESTHACTPRLANGSPLPTDAPHAMPKLDGACTPGAALLVCQSGVCDAADNACGHALGKGPCDAGNGAVVCRSLVCAVLGANAGTCVACVSDTQCQGALPVCDLGKDACVQCTAAESGACLGATPVCAVGPGTCVPCDGDRGDGTPAACPKSDGPYCFLAGASMGQCGKCATNADCAGHKAGPRCDAATGACGVACHADADCDVASWCNAPAGGGGACVPKLDNGTALPTTPASVGICTPAVGARVCTSGACDPVDDTCGLVNGDGPCADGAVCRSGACDGKDQRCGLLPLDGPCASAVVCRAGGCDAVKQVCAGGGCTLDRECPAGDFCQGSGVCAPRLPDGALCDGASQCQSDACTSGKCDGLLASGTGVSCAASPAPRSGDDAGVVLLGLMLASAGLARRRRR